MARRVTSFNRVLLRHGMGAAREMVLQAVQRKGGNLRRVAFDLNLSRRHLYRVLMFANLWEEVVAARKRARRPDELLARALEEL